MTEHTYDRDVDRFLAKVLPSITGCWFWIGRLEPEGYGKFRFKGRPQWAHRVAHELFLGPIPDGFEPDHLCRNRPCANPTHLEVVTHRENVLRGESPTAANGRKTHCIRGHELAGANVHVRPAGTRVCRVCERERVAALRRAA